MNRKKGHPSIAPSDARVLRLVFQRPGLVRGDVPELLNLSAAGAAAAIRDLMRQGALLQSGQAPSQGGRPASKLLVAPDLAMAFSHVVCSLGLKSALVNVGGEVLTSTCSEVDSVADIPKQIADVEMRLSGSQNGVPLVGSALVLPGSPHPTNRSLGKAPWLFGANQIDVSERNQIVVTNATALFRAEAATRPELTRELTLAIDLNDGASAVVGTPEGSRLALNLMGMSIPESAFVRPRFAEAIQREAERPDTCLRIHVENGHSPEEALREAEEQRDVVACRVVDELTEQLSTFIASLCRMLRPANAIVSSWLISALGKSEEVERLVRRRCPAVAADAMKFHHSAPNESTHLVGGALMAIDEWLLSLESEKSLTSNKT